MDYGPLFILIFFFSSENEKLREAALREMEGVNIWTYFQCLLQSVLTKLTLSVDIAYWLGHWVLDKC